MIPHKRAFLAKGLRLSGALTLLERLARRPGLLVLTYHRIVESTGPFYPQVASATPETLHDELSALARSRRVVTLNEALTLAEGRFETAEALALVTFDDGYRDNADAALPVLRALGVPATFFLTTNFLDGVHLPWWDHVSYVVNTSRVRVLKVARPSPLELDLAAVPRPEAVARLIRAYLDHLETDERALRLDLEASAEVMVDEARLSRSLFMTWDDARSLVSAGMSIGSHTVSHRALGRLSEVEQRAELAGSKRRLETELGCSVSALAYPYGWPGMFDATTARIAREVGYRSAFLSREGINPPGAADPFSILRLGVGRADPPVLHRARWALHGAFGGSIL